MAGKGRSSKPVQLLKLEGKSHRTKEELEHREKMEKTLYTGETFVESPAVESDPVAHKEFMRLKNLYSKIQYVDGLDEQLINRYCMLISEEQSMLEMIKQEEDNSAKVKLYKDINKLRETLLKIEDRLLLNPTARMRAIPKTPPEKEKKNPMAEFLNRRTGNNAT